MNIADVFGHKLRGGHFGIEVELEFPQGVIPPPYSGGVWIHKGDGSLKNGMEYISRQPLTFNDSLKTHLSQLFTAVAHSNPIDGAPTGSVHVHANVQEFKPIEVWNLACLYWLFENILMDFCGKADRCGNLFCLRLRDAEGIIKDSMRDLNLNVPFGSFHEDSVKYGGVNLATVRRFGSLEFRGLRSTTDPNLIYSWCEILFSLMRASKTFKSPAMLMNAYLASSKDSFLLSCLPESFCKGIVEKYPDYVQMVRRNALSVATLAYSVNDWDQWEKKQVSMVVKAKANFANDLLDSFSLAQTAPNNTHFFTVSTTSLIGTGD